MMIKSEYTHEVFHKDIHCPQGLLENKNYAELENFFNVLWQSRSHKLYCSCALLGFLGS
ncbi:hypothetical protein D3C75_1099060 [compost metagenome]